MCRATGVVLGAHPRNTIRTGRAVAIPPDEYTVEILAMTLDEALNEFAVAGSGEPSGSVYLGSQVGNKIMVQIGPEVNNDLDSFVILPEGTSRALPSSLHNAQNTRSLNPLLRNMGV